LLQAQQPRPDDEQLALLLQQANDTRRHPDQRRAAIRELSAFRGNVAVRKLMIALLMPGSDQETDPFIRQAAAETLALIADDPQQREDASVILRSLLTQEAHLQTQQVLAGLIEQLRPLIPLERLRAAWREALQQADLARQRQLLLEIARHPATDRWPDLTRVLQEDPDPRIRGLALQLLLRGSEERAIALARTVVRDPANPDELRSSALALLTMHEPLESLAPLLRNLMDSHPGSELSIQVITAIGRGQLLDFTADLLERFERETHPTTRLALVDALAQLAAHASANPVLQARLIAKLESLPETLANERVLALVKVMARYGDDRHIPYLTSLLTSADLELRHASVLALSQIGGIAAGQALLSTFAAQPPTMRAAMLRAIARLRIPALWPLLARQLSYVREAEELVMACRAVGSLAPPDEGDAVLSALRLRGEGETLSTEVIVQRGWLGSPASFKPLLHDLRSGSTTQAMAAARALRARVPQYTAHQLEALAEAMGIAAPQVVDVLLLMIGFAGSMEAGQVLDRIATQLPARHQPALWQARSLVQTVPPGLLALVRQALTGSQEVAAIAASALGRLGDASDVARLAELGDRPGMASASVHALALLGEPAAGPAIARWLERDDLEFADRLTVLTCYAAVPGVAVDRQLVKLLASRSIPEMTHIIELLANRPALDTEVVSALIQALDAASPSLRGQAALTLATVGREEHLSLLLARHAQESDRQARAALVQAIGILGGESARRWLRQAVEQGLGSDETIELLLAAGRSGLQLPERDIQRLVQADPAARVPAAGLLVIAGDGRARRWLWRDMLAPDAEVAARSREALRLSGDQDYFSLAIARAHIESFPRPELLQLAKHLPGAPQLRWTSRRDQDVDLAALREWWQTHRASLRWDASTRQFVR
jgi:HEAT repeat protein